MVEAQPRILPGYDEELTKPVAQALRKLGVELYLGHSLLGPSENGVRVRDGAGEEREIVADQVLVAVGRKPRSEGWNLESLGLDMNGRAVKVDDQCRTSMRNVWAIGDLAGEPMLAHRAMAQGEMVAELIAGKRRQFAPVAIPRCASPIRKWWSPGCPRSRRRMPAWTAWWRASRSPPTAAP